VSSVREELEGFVAGRVKAERVVEAVAAAYYGGEGGRGTRDGLKALMEIIERAHPGIVALAGTTEKPGFGVRLAERPFPKEYEADFREAVQAVLGRGVSDVASTVTRPGLLSRLYSAVRRLFTASA